jgi:peroxiredoxin
MKNHRHLALWIAAAALALIGFVLVLGVLERRTPAPDVPFTRLDGSVGRIGGLKGQVVLVNFWATSCATCVKEMPQLVATHEKFKTRGFETLAVAMSHDAPASVVHFTQSRRLPFTVVIDLSGEVARSFDDVKVTPTTLLIDKHGAIVKRIVGEPDFPALHARIEALLAER